MEYSDLEVSATWVSDNRLAIRIVEDGQRGYWISLDSDGLTSPDIENHSLRIIRYRDKSDD